VGFHPPPHGSRRCPVYPRLRYPFHIEIHSNRSTPFELETPCFLAFHAQPDRPRWRSENAVSQMDSLSRNRARLRRSSEQEGSCARSADRPRAGRTSSRRGHSGLISAAYHPPEGTDLISRLPSASPVELGASRGARPVRRRLARPKPRRPSGAQTGRSIRWSLLPRAGATGKRFCASRSRYGSKRVRIPPAGSGAVRENCPLNAAGVGTFLLREEREPGATTRTRGPRTNAAAGKSSTTRGANP
jgi:hypothetical protein